jgi:hypothetical protein
MWREGLKPVAARREIENFLDCVQLTPPKFVNFDCFQSSMRLWYATSIHKSQRKFRQSVYEQFALSYGWNRTC